MASVGLKITPQPLCWSRTPLLMMRLCATTGGTNSHTCPFIKSNRTWQGRLLSRPRLLNDLMCFYIAHALLWLEWTRKTERNLKSSLITLINSSILTWTKITAKTTVVILQTTGQHRIKLIFYFFYTFLCQIVSLNIKVGLAQYMIKVVFIHISIQK